MLIYTATRWHRSLSCYLFHLTLVAYIPHSLPLGFYIIMIYFIHICIVVQLQRFSKRLALPDLEINRTQ